MERGNDFEGHWNRTGEGRTNSNQMESEDSEIAMKNYFY